MMIKFVVQAAALVGALASVAIVPPRPVGQGGAGYLFVVRGETLHVYSRDNTHAARASVPITDVEGEGSFIYPAKHTSSFGYLGDEMVTLTATAEGEAHRVAYSTGTGAGAERSTFDPRLLAPLDRDLDAAVGERTFPAALLREAFSQARAFLPEPGDKIVNEALRGVQLFDGKVTPGEKANGYVYAANGTLAMFFRSDALYDKGLHVHSQHLSMVLAFLGKAGQTVTVRDGASMTFLSDEQGRVLGWAHSAKKHEAFSYYSLDQDVWVAKVAASPVLHALKYVRSEMDKRTKVRVQYDAEGKQMTFGAAGGTEKVTSFPVPVEMGTDHAAWSASFNLDHLLELFTGIRGNELEVRAYMVAPSEARPRGLVMLRTVDEFVLSPEGKIVGGSGVEILPEGASRCRVTRFLPSME
jgi:hypothetical protein